MLTLNPSMYTAGIRPSLRAMTDSIFGDVWHSHSPSPSHNNPTNNNLVSIPPTTPVNAARPRPLSTYSHSHSRSSSYSSVQSSLARTPILSNDLHAHPLPIPLPHIPPTMSPTLALARHSFHSPPSSPVHSPTSSISTIEAVNSWPSPRGIEYVRSTVHLSEAPSSRPRRPKPQPIKDAERSPGLQPLWLEPKARPCSHSPSHQRKDLGHGRPTGHGLANGHTNGHGPESAPLERTDRSKSRQSRELVAIPTSPDGLRPLLLATKARPARSAEQRARDKVAGKSASGGTSLEDKRRGRTTWHAEPVAQLAPPPAKTGLSFRERARRTIASVAEIDW